MDCKGGCKMKAGGKTCEKCGCDMEDEEYEKGEKKEKEMRSGGMACMKCGGKMHKSGGTVSSCMKCGGGKYTFGGKVNWSKKKVTSNSSEKYASGGMIKRADGSYSERGLWDNIRANAGSGKEPTKQMLEQEKKIKQKMAVGGMVDEPCPTGFVRDPRTGECIQKEMIAYNDSSQVYNAMLMQNKILGGNKNIVPLYENFEFNEWSKSKVDKIKNDPNLNQDPRYRVYNSFDEMMKSGIDQKHKDVIMAYRKLGIPDKNIAFYTSPDLIDTKIKPIADYEDGYAYSPYFKKPTKPAVRVPVAEYTQQDLDNAFKQRREQEDYAAYEKWVSENPLSEPKSMVNDEMEITYYKPINMPVKSSGLIPTNEIIPNTNTGIKYQKESDQGSYPTMSGEEQGMTNKKGKRKYSFGGAVSSMKKYLYGGEIDNTEMTTDAEMPLSKGAYDVPEPTYDASAVSDESPMQVTDNATQGTDQIGYKEIVKSFQKKNVDKSLPNWGYAKQEQTKLNELIIKDISTGNAKMDLLVEDDIIGDNTLKAMRAYEANGQYTRPEGFKDKWLAEYKKQWDESKTPKQETPKVKTPEQKQPTKATGSFNIPSMSDIVTGVQSGMNYGLNAIDNFIQNTGGLIQGAGNLIEKYQNTDTKKEIDQPKVNEKTNLDDLYSYFNNYKEKPKDKSNGYGTVLRPEEPKYKSKAGKYSAERYTTGWPKTALLQEGGIEISASDLKRKDFDTYFPIPGVSKSKKGVRATGRDNNRSFFDAVEKSQKNRKDGTSSNTSLQLIDKLLSSSNKVIVIPKGKDKYGRDLNDIYLQDPNYPDNFHALDSLGVVEGEAIFGTTLFPLPENLTPRQQKINKQAEEKGGYKYKQSPSDFRKFEKLGIKEKPLSSVFENPELETEIINRQKYDNKQYGKFMSKGKNVANRTDIKRNADSEAFFADYAEPNSVIIDIGSALGNPNPSLAGVSVNELAKNQSIKKKNIKVIGTDIPSEVETFKMHQRNKQALDIDYAEVPMSYNTPVTKILKDKNLSDRENVYLRSANSIDLLMTPEETKQHLEHIAKTLKDKNVTYVFNNIILTKPKGLTMFGKVGNINNAAFDHNAPSWKSNTNRKPYTLINS